MGDPAVGRRPTGITPLGFHRQALSNSTSTVSPGARPTSPATSSARSPRPACTSRADSLPHHRRGVPRRDRRHPGEPAVHCEFPGAAIVERPQSRASATADATACGRTALHSSCVRHDVLVWDACDGAMRILAIYPRGRRQPRHDRAPRPTHRAAPAPRGQPARAGATRSCPDRHARSPSMRGEVAAGGKVTSVDTDIVRSATKIIGPPRRPKYAHPRRCRKACIGCVTINTPEQIATGV